MRLENLLLYNIIVNLLHISSTYTQRTTISLYLTLDKEKTHKASNKITKQTKNKKIQASPLITECENQATADT